MFVQHHLLKSTAKHIVPYYQAQKEIGYDIGPQIHQVLQ
jgi:hypothetical protein